MQNGGSWGEADRDSSATLAREDGPVRLLR